MKPIERFVCLLVACAGIAQTAKIPIDISGIANQRWTIFDGGETMPTGDQQYNGVPFRIPSEDRNAWIQFGNQGGKVTITPNVVGATTVYTLMNTVWGQAGPASYVSLEFTGSKGATYTKNLVGNIDIRDFNAPTEFADQINTTTTINAWTGPFYQGDSFHLLDQQIITLPAAFATQTLTTVTITDTGRDGFQHAILAALTVDGVAFATDHLITGVCDAAGCQELISPGSIASLFGVFAEQTATAQSVPLPFNLTGFSVTFNGLPGALFGVFFRDDFGTLSDQANVQVPWDLDVSSGKVEVRVHWQGTEGEEDVWSDPFEVNAAQASPGIFMLGTQAIVTNASSGNDDVIPGSWAQPAGFFPGLTGQPAAIGGGWSPSGVTGWDRLP